LAQFFETQLYDEALRFRFAKFDDWESPFLPNPSRMKPPYLTGFWQPFFLTLNFPFYIFNSPKTQFLSAQNNSIIAHDRIAGGVTDSDENDLKGLAEGLQKSANKVVMILKIGQSLWLWADYLKGDMENSITWGKVGAKFRTLARLVEGKAVVWGILQHQDKLKNLPNHGA